MKEYTTKNIKLENKFTTYYTLSFTSGTIGSEGYKDKTITINNKSQKEIDDIILSHCQEYQNIKIYSSLKPCFAIWFPFSPFFFVLLVSILIKALFGISETESINIILVCFQILAMVFSFHLLIRAYNSDGGILLVNDQYWVKVNSGTVSYIDINQTTPYKNE